MTATLAYNPTQPRDASGRWGSGGSGLSAADQLVAAAPEATVDQGSAIHAYTGASARVINRRLRASEKLNTHETAVAGHLDGYLAKAVVPADVTVYRGMMFNPDQFQPGAEFTNRGYTSTTLSGPEEGDTSPASHGNVIIQITVPAGTKNAAYVGEYSSYGHEEREVLFGRGLRLRVDRRGTFPVTWMKTPAALLECSIVEPT